MDSRIALLAVPSFLALALLVDHSFRALPRGRAIAFWVSVLAYGLLRGWGVAWITRTIGAKFPYELHDPLLTIFGVSAQEIAGWAIVAYLAWWIGSRYAPDRIFAQVAIGALFLGCVSWAVEAAAIAAGWWHWNVPTASRFFLNVPPIGLVDWFFVATDFLLPFLAITSLRSPWRFATLLLFPLHFGSHLFLEPIHPAIPIPAFHLVHWLLLAMLIVLGGRASRPLASGILPDASMLPGRMPGSGGRDARRPLLAVAIIILDVAFVLLFVAREPRLLIALVPLTLLVAASSMRIRIPRVPWPAVLVIVFAFAWFLHARIAADREELRRRLDAAILARDRGDVAFASTELESLTREFPTSHVPFALLGEIRYRTKNTSEARTLFERAFAIKQDYLDGYRYAAVIALQNGDTAAARRIAKRGLDVAPSDAQLQYLAGGSPSATSAEESITLAGLAFEVGDRATTIRVLDEGIAKWPEDRRLRDMRRAAR